MIRQKDIGSRKNYKLIPSAFCPLPSALPPKVVNHAKNKAIALGASKIVIQGDPNAKKFYLSAGGIITGERESVSISGRYLPTFTIELDR